MLEINYQFSREKAKNAQHVQFATDTLAAIPEDVATEQGFGSLRATYEEAVTNEILCFKPDKSYMDTPEIVEADALRDDTFLFYDQIVDAYATYCPDPEKRKAGKTAKHVFHEAGSPTREDYTSETALLTDAAARLREEPYSSALTTIGLEAAPDDIAEANDAFHAIYQKRAAEMRDRKTTFTMKALRPVTDDAFDALAKAINALYLTNELVTKDEDKAAALKKVIDDVNAVVISFRSVIGGSADVDPELPDEPAEEETPEPGGEEDRPQVQ